MKYEKEKQLKIYFHFVNYKRLAFLFILSLGISQQSYKGIHQLELEYNNENFVEPLYKTYSEPANPITQIKKNTSRKVFGYHPYWQGTKWQNYNFELLSTIAYFSAEANENGELVNLHGWPATDLINKAHDNGVEVVLTVTLFSKTKLETLLSSNENRKRLIDNLKSEVERAGADGVNIDFESFPESQRLNLITFVKDLRFSLRSSIPNAQVTLATPAVDWNNAWDFKSLANESDGLFIMGYDYHWKGSTLTGPVAPLTGGSYNVSNTINTYLSITENNLDKIILGVPYYGYSWPSLSGEKGSNTTGTGSAELFSSAEARALSYGKKWDTLSQTPWYRFQNPDWFQTWYDDSLSLSKKYDFVNAKNLGGIGIWALGYDDGYNELWDALKDKIANKSNPSIPIGYSVESLGGGMLSVNFSNVENATGYEVVEIISESNQERTVGKFLKSPILIQGLKDDIPYFYKVRALNQFGFSEFTELLGSTPSPVNSKVLIVNGFDRVAGTANTFDFILEHGNAIYTNGFSFDAASNEAIINEKIKLNDYEIVDWILGEEGAATSAFDEREKILLQDYIIKGGRLFVSGSEIGYDMSEKGNNSDRIFYENILKAEYISDAAGGTSGVYEIEGTPNSLFNGYTFSFDNGENGNYDVDWPDGIKPAGNAVNILNFRDVDYEARGGAGIAYRGTFLNSKIPSGIVYLSIGFESIYPEEVRTDVMKEVLQFLEAPIASVIDDEPIVPGGLSISALYPNPSNQSISIEFKVKELSPIAFLTITDLLGREVFKMSALSLPTKIQRFNWNGLTKDGNKAPSGVYLVYLSQGNKIVNKKFTLLK